VAEADPVWYDAFQLGVSPLASCYQAVVLLPNSPERPIFKCQQDEAAAADPRVRVL
jgi:hypothetical protein